MTSKILRFFTATTFALSVAALAQTNANTTALPSAPSAANSAAPVATGTRVATINMEQAIYASNEGQRDLEALSKKLEPKEAELKTANDEVESLKKQLDTQGTKLNDDARGTLVKQIEEKQKRLERSVQEAREDAESQRNEVAKKILQKMGPILLKYAAENGYGLLLDTSSPWPNGPVIWNGPSMDITPAVIGVYNTQSGVAAPVRTTPTAKPSTGAPISRPAPPAAKPQAPAPK
ncbi:MAG TPA: OmpH family outer membrane protein [Terriglobales bacterium]|jgi:outer membrane protein|nr:OmpH family outer membrane protein [Terriglobales bacterium]